MDFKNEKKSAFQPSQNVNQPLNTIQATENADRLNSKIVIWCFIIGIAVFTFFLWRQPKEYLIVDFYVPDSKLINSIPDILNFKAPSMTIMNIEHYAKMVILRNILYFIFSFFRKMPLGPSYFK